jgi:chaperonin GroEL
MYVYDICQKIDTKETYIKLYIGYEYSHFITDKENKVCEFSNPYVLISEEEIDSLWEIYPLMDLLAKQGKSIVVFAPRIRGEALSFLEHNALNGSLKSVPINTDRDCEMDYKKYLELLKDLAMFTGATVISNKNDVLLEDVKTPYLGKLESIKVYKKYSLMFGDSEKTKKIINKNITHLTKELDDLQGNISRLTKMI